MLNAKTMLAGLCGMLLLAGCANRTPTQVDQKFGEAVNTAKAQQIINPDGPRNTDPVKGIDGKAADATVDRYHKSFESPPPPVNVFTIGVGGGGGAK